MTESFNTLIDLSYNSDEEEKWYVKFQRTFELKSREEAVLYQAAMYQIQSSVRSGKEREKAIDDFLSNPGPKRMAPEKRELLKGIAEKIVSGKDLPEF